MTLNESLSGVGARLLDLSTLESAGPIKNRSGGIVMSCLPTSFTLEVKQEHIYSGIKSDCRLCPIALALKDHFKQASSLYVSVGCNFIAVSTNYGRATYTSDSNRHGHFIERFDEGKTVQPTTFTFRSRQ